MYITKEYMNIYKTYFYKKNIFIHNFMKKSFETNSKVQIQVLLSFSIDYLVLFSSFYDIRQAYHNAILTIINYDVLCYSPKHSNCSASDEFCLSVFCSIEHSPSFGCDCCFHLFCPAERCCDCLLYLWSRAS